MFLIFWTGSNQFVSGRLWKSEFDGFSSTFCFEWHQNMTNGEGVWGRKHGHTFRSTSRIQSIKMSWNLLLGSSPPLWRSGTNPTPWSFAKDCTTWSFSETVWNGCISIYLSIYLILSYPVLSYPILSYLSIYLILSYPSIYLILSYLILSFPIYLILSIYLSIYLSIHLYIYLSYLILSYPILSIYLSI